MFTISKFVIIDFFIKIIIYSFIYNKKNYLIKFNKIEKKNKNKRLKYKIKEIEIIYLINYS